MKEMMMILPLLMATMASAATTSESGFLVKTKLTYQTPKSLIESVGELILPNTNKGWTPLTYPKEGVVLLGRMVKFDSATIHLEYMLVDTRNAESSVVSTPSIITRLGEEAKVSVDTAGDKISISLLAKKTSFQKEAVGSTLNPDFTKLRPVEFLKMLQEKCCEAVTVTNAPEGWITDADVKELRKLLKDSRPASPVYNPLSSHLCGKSTVKREALYLIKGFTEKRYPPGLCSTDFKLGSVKVPK
ncbi:MAG: hypothetical protein NDJ90_07110 [Oligoflexia bacterium]|nr:hypothetical protein [Oligoflexia bacterium]